MDSKCCEVAGPMLQTNRMELVYGAKVVSRLSLVGIWTVLSAVLADGWNVPVADLDLCAESLRLMEVKSPGIQPAARLTKVALMTKKGPVFTRLSEIASDDWKQLYEPMELNEMPYRIMKPIQFDKSKRYPLILSLHGGGGRGSDNQKQLKKWNQQLAESERRTRFPCYVLAPQAKELWDASDLKNIKTVIKNLPSVDMNRIYVLGHSMGGHGTYIFIQLDPDYFAAAAPSAGSGLKQTENFIEPAKIKDLPIWAFHGDKDGVCPIEKDQMVFDAMRSNGGNMKFTIWKGDSHAVSGKFIVGGENGVTTFSSDRCDTEPDFMTWLFKQKR